MNDWFVQLMKQAPVVRPPLNIVPSNVDPLKLLNALPRQPQQPPQLAFVVSGLMAPCARFPRGGAAAIFFTPRCQRSGCPANSAHRSVVDVPSVTWSMLILAPLKALLFITPWLLRH